MNDKRRSYHSENPMCSGALCQELAANANRFLVVPPCPTWLMSSLGVFSCSGVQKSGGFSCSGVQESGVFSCTGVQESGGFSCTGVQESGGFSWGKHWAWKY
jgi:hypothetical protein